MASAELAQQHEISDKDHLDETTPNTFNEHLAEAKHKWEKLHINPKEVERELNNPSFLQILKDNGILIKNATFNTINVDNGSLLKRLSKLPKVQQLFLNFKKPERLSPSLFSQKNDVQKLPLDSLPNTENNVNNFHNCHETSGEIVTKQPPSRNKLFAIDMNENKNLSKLPASINKQLQFFNMGTNLQPSVIYEGNEEVVSSLFNDRLSKFSIEIIENSTSSKFCSDCIQDDGILSIIQGN